MNQQQNQIVHQVTQKIVDKYDPDKVILFGSQIWGKTHEWSDIDLFIVKPSSKKRWEREYELRLKLIGNQFPPLDLLIYTPEEVKSRLEIGDLFIQDILDHGQIVYAK